MKQFEIIARAIGEIETATKELFEAMNAGADLNYFTLYDMLAQTQHLKRDFKAVVYSRKANPNT